MSVIVEYDNLYMYKSEVKFPQNITCIFVLKKFVKYLNLLLEF
jgi:hypothetical protein